MDRMGVETVRSQALTLEDYLIPSYGERHGLWWPPEGGRRMDGSARARCYTGVTAVLNGLKPYARPPAPIPALPPSTSTQHAIAPSDDPHRPAPPPPARTGNCCSRSWGSESERLGLLHATTLTRSNAPSTCVPITRRPLQARW